MYRIVRRFLPVSVHLPQYMIVHLRLSTSCAQDVQTVRMYISPEKNPERTFVYYSGGMAEAKRESTLMFTLLCESDRAEVLPEDSLSVCFSQDCCSIFCGLYGV